MLDLLIFYHYDILFFLDLLHLLLDVLIFLHAGVADYSAGVADLFVECVHL